MNRAPIAAAITPRNRREEIDFGAGFELIDLLCRGGVGGIALFTALGEYASLAAEERSRFLCLAVKRSRAPVWAGVGAATLDASLDLAHEARYAGAGALLLPPPYGFAYAQDDVREFYLRFAERNGAGTPVYLIDSPGLCTPVDPATASELVASGAFEGVADFVSDTACAIPELVVAGMTEKIAEFECWAREFPSPVAIKTAVNVRGISTGPLPVPLTAAKQRRLDEFRAWFKDWLGPARKSAHG